MMTLWRTLLILFVMIGTAQAKPLVGDISNHEITLHTAFSGTELILFGARNEPGDIVVVVRGPDRKATVRRKERAYGIWINRAEEEFSFIPGFYHLASSRSYEKIKKSIYYQALGIGYNAAISPYMPLDDDIPEPSLIEDSERKSFSRALIRSMRAQKLYNQSSSDVEFIGETLFKISIPFPDITPRGKYTAELYLFSGGELVGMHTTPINVYKVGFDAFVYQMAHQNPLLYGFIAVCVALFGGWFASTVFKRL